MNKRKGKQSLNIYAGGGFAKFLNKQGNSIFGSSGESANTVGKLGLTQNGMSLANMGAGLISNIGGELINNNGLHTATGDIMSSVGSVASMIPGVGGLIGAGVNLLGGVTNAAFGSKLNKDFINKTEGQIEGQMGQNFSDSSADALYSDWGNMGLLDNVSKGQVGKDGWFKNKAKRKAKRLNRQIDNANDFAINTFGNATDNLSQNTLEGHMSNYFAEGGNLSHLPKQSQSSKQTNVNQIISSSIKKSKDNTDFLYKNQHLTNIDPTRISNNSEENNKNLVYKLAMGGSLNNMKNNIFDLGGALLGPNIGGASHGADFSSGVKFIKNGGTHEQNPNQGVPIGVDQEGNPNLVEEGEVVFNDYVYSNRIQADKKFLESTNLDKKYSGKTYAYIAEKLTEESSERENDPISLNGLHANMGKLMAAQELQKQEDEMSKMTEMFDKMKDLSEEDAVQLAEDMGLFGQEEQQEYSDEMGNQIMPEDMSQEVPQGELIQPELQSRQFATGGFTIDDPFGVKDMFASGAKYNNTALKIQFPQYFAPPASSGDSRDKGSSLASLRYAPILGNISSVIQDKFNKPDYSAVDKIETAIKPVQKVTNPRLNDYMTYSPLDTDYLTNKLDLQQASNRSNIRNMSGGNRATAVAGLMASDSAHNSQRGKLFRKAQDYNNAQRQKVSEFNRTTNQYNADSAYRTTATNAQNTQALNQQRLGAYTSQAQLKDQIDTKLSAAKSSNLSNLFNNLGMLGKEETSRNMIGNIPGLGYYLSRMGKTQFKGGGE